jgi:hypothetical protein
MLETVKFFEFPVAVPCLNEIILKKNEIPEGAK